VRWLSAQVFRGYPLVAMGQGGRSDDTVGPTHIIVSNAPVMFPPCLFGYVDLSSVQLELIGPDGLVFDSCEYTTFKGPSIITYHGDGAAVKWQAANPTPVDHLIGHSGNRYEFGAVVVQGGGQAANVFHIDPERGSFSENTITWKELFGGRRDLEGGGFVDVVFRISNPAAATAVRHNLFEGTHVHGCAVACVQVGVAGTNQANLLNNQWRIGSINPSAPAAVGFSSFGSSDTVTASVSRDAIGAAYAHSAVFATGARYNRIFLNDSGSTAGLSNSGSGNAISRNGAISLPIVGVDVAPAYPLHVYRSTYTSSKVGANILGRFQSNARGADANIQFSDGVANSAQIGLTGGAVYITSNGTEFVRVSPSGNVGIGTADPVGYKLYVNGKAYATGGWTGSDERLKKNIATLDRTLEKVLRLRGVSFDWRTEEFPDRGLDDRRQIGLIAQELEHIYPELVSTDPQGWKAIDYSRLTAILVEALKAQQAQITALQAEVERLKADRP